MQLLYKIVEIGFQILFLFGLLRALGAPECGEKPVPKDVNDRSPLCSFADAVT
jgi:hypothetical protein